MITFRAYLTFNGVTKVHADGCADLKRLRNSQHDTPYPITVPDGTPDAVRDAVAADVSSDFIEEGSMDPAEALEHVDFAPCTGLQ